MWDLRPGICGPSRQVVSHGSGLSRQVILYMIFQHVLQMLICAICNLKCHSRFSHVHWCTQKPDPRARFANSTNYSQFHDNKIYKALNHQTFAKKYTFVKEYYAITYTIYPVALRKKCMAGTVLLGLISKSHSSSKFQRSNLITKLHEYKNGLYICIYITCMQSY